VVAPSGNRHVLYVEGEQYQVYDTRAGALNAAEQLRQQERVGSAYLMARDFWADQANVAMLRQLWSEGVPTAEIGRRMNRPKYAVIGKAHRLGLAARPSPIRPRKARRDAQKL